MTTTRQGITAGGTYTSSGLPSGFTYLDDLFASNTIHDDIHVGPMRTYQVSGVAFRTRWTVQSGPQQTAGWRVNVAQLAMLSRLEVGWDAPDSLPMERGAQANYLQWISGMPTSRMRDAEPTLTDEGYIRMEWRHGEFDCIAEIGANYLYLCRLAPDRRDDDSVEFHEFDSQRLTFFFARGELR